MAVYKFEQEIGADHIVTLPLTVPAGWAEIHVIPRAEVTRPREDFRTLAREMTQLPSYNRSKEDIDCEIRAERDAWE